MSLKLMYITNREEIATIAENSGVDRIFVDMEYVGKSDRQGGMDTVQSRHTIEDVRRIRSTVHKAKLLVRVNPIHEASELYQGSEAEINDVIREGADIIMLPYFKTVEDVKRFLSIVDRRVPVCLLVETPEAVACMDEILAIPGIDEVLVGLNDLSLGYGKKFMFELLADGTVEALCKKFAKAGIPYGFGGIASMGKGMLPSEYVIKEHYRLGSTCAILSRSFCDVRKLADLHQAEEIFKKGIVAIRDYEDLCRLTPDTYESNQQTVKFLVDKIVSNT